MSSEWTPFTELLSAIVDNRGKTCPVSDTGIPLIATNCVDRSNLYPAYNTTRFVSEDTYKTWFRGHPLPGDILFVCKGSPGRTNWVPNPVDFCIAQDMVAVRANPNRIYPKYLFAALRSSVVQSQIDNMHVGTMIPHFKKGDFDKLNIPVPSHDAQTIIGDFYFTLSERITLLRETNATLEAIAQALFKSWFVDFDPVHAKMQGTQPEGMDEQTAALFPDSFDESVVGLVPAGWEVGTLKDVVKVIDNRGKTPPYQDIATQYPIIEVNALKGDDRLVDYSVIKKYVSEETFNSWFRGHPKKFDTLIATVGSIGATSMFLIEKGSIAQNVIALTPMTLSPIYLFQYLKKVKGEIKELDIGSVQPSIKVPHLLATKIFIPSAETLSAFDAKIECCLEKIAVNYEQAQTLSDLRDTLLPRLISGQLRVGDVDATT